MGRGGGGEEESNEEGEAGLTFSTMIPMIKIQTIFRMVSRRLMAPRAAKSAEESQK